MRLSVILSFATLLVLGGCGGESLDGFSFGDLFSDDKGSPFQVKNEAGFDIVVFRNSLSEANKIGGIKSGYSYGMKQTEGIGGLYVLKAISSADYQTAVETGTFSNAKIVDSMMVYITSTRTTNYIRNKTGAGAVVFNNKTGKYIEVYSGYWGETDNMRVVLTPQESSAVQFMPTGPYTFYCSVVEPQTNNGQLVYIKRKNIKDRPIAQIDSGSRINIDINADPTPEDKFIYVHVKNNRDSGNAVTFQSGLTGSGGLLEQGMVFRSTLNHLYINAQGGVEVYQISPLEGTDYREYPTASLGFKGTDFSAIVNPTSPARFTNGNAYYFIVHEGGVFSTTPF